MTERPALMIRFLLGIAAGVISLAACSSTTESIDATSTAASASALPSAATSAPESTSATLPREPSTDEAAPSSTAVTTYDVDTTVARPDIAVLLDRSWRVAAYATADGEQTVSGEYTNTVTFQLDGTGAASVTTDGCVNERLSIAFRDDSTFAVGQPIGDVSACMNPDDAGQHAGDPLTPGSTVRWSIGDDGRLTLTPNDATDRAVMYVDLASPQPPLQCVADDLTATAEPLGDSAMSNTRLVIDVTNISDRACVLPTTPPTLTGVGPDGAQVPLVSKGDGTYFGSPPPLDGPLEVGETAVVWLGGGQPGVCDPLDATQTWSSMLLGLPDGSSVPFTTPFDTKCGLNVTNSGTPPG